MTEYIADADILVVDDTPTNLRVLSMTLRRAGFDVRAARDGRQALEQVDEHRPDLILLDVSMPGLTGYEVCEILKGREDTRDIPILFVSAMDQTEDIVRAFAVGGVDYITKPIQFEEVLARVRTHLSLRALQDQLRQANAELHERLQDLATANSELQTALDQVKVLRGLIPICASCKKIRDDKGYWQDVEEYVQTRSEAEFSHGICPDCARRLYPDFIDDRDYTQG